VLVYGEWPNESKNIQPFISATYTEAEKQPFIKRDYSKTLEFVFAGALVVGKRPLLTIQIIEALNKKGYPSRIHLFGDGPLMTVLKAYVTDFGLDEQVMLYGNRDKEEVKNQLIQSHFNILPSKSEGWPKAVAEGMFFGCIPVATPVSCVSWMLGEGVRGILIEPQLELAVSKILDTLSNSDLDVMAKAAFDWSQQYTFDRLEKDIKKVLEGAF
jgi:glycosyltransferase involved in cell wall biosynthesis